MRILAIDPGNVKSAWVEYDVESGSILSFADQENETVLARVAEMGAKRAEKGLSATISLLVIEYPYPRGQPMSYQLVDTIFWIGRFVQVWGHGWRAIDRKDVKLCVCGSANAKDPNVRTGLIARFQHLATGGGKEPVVGTKKEPGPLFGFAGDLWAALGVAITFESIFKTQEFSKSDEKKLSDLFK